MYTLPVCCDERWLWTKDRVLRELRGMQSVAKCMLWLVLFSHFFRCFFLEELKKNKRFREYGIVTLDFP